MTLTARLANGQARAGTGTLTVLRGRPAGRPRACADHDPAPAPVGKDGERRGIVVLIRGHKGGTARVQLFPGRGDREKATKRVRLRVPGPIKVVLKSCGSSRAATGS